MGTVDKDVFIDTDKISVKDNVIFCENTIVQISNISCITTGNVRKKAFPILSLFILLVGILLFKENKLLGIFALLFSVAWIVTWFIDNEKRTQQSYLNIILNSGDNLSILFMSREFMYKVINVLGAIIMQGGVGSRKVLNINVKGNTFNGDVDLLNELNSTM